MDLVAKPRGANWWYLATLLTSEAYAIR